MIKLDNYNMLPIEKVAEKININSDVLYNYGKYIAKVPYDYKSDEPTDAKLILVTAMTPTKSGEGKTLTSIGLSMALNRLGKKTVACLRQGSLGPVFGVKGCAIGSGNSTILPTEELAFGLTGDLDAITNANNLLSAIIDNHIYQGNTLNIDPNNIFWKRCIDTCDRSLKTVKTGWIKKGIKTEIESHFDITAASEILTILTLSNNIEELKEKLGNIMVAYDIDGNPIYSRQLNCVGAMISILKKAFNPNLVQTCEGTPVLVHGGTFANISSGTNTIVNTKLGMRLGDYVVTEAGFAADLGAEKFLDIKCRKAGIFPNAVVLVATIKALKHHGGDDSTESNPKAVAEGFNNLLTHYHNMTSQYGLPTVVCLNHFPTDTAEEIAMFEKRCQELEIPYAFSEGYSEGSAGVIDLAKKVLGCIESNTSAPKYTYKLDDPLHVKISDVARKIYKSPVVIFSEDAMTKLTEYERLGYGNLPVCIAKTQYSISDDPNLLGIPLEQPLHVRDVEIKTGAGFVIVLCGTMVTMPGLPKTPNAEKIDLTYSGEIVGLS